MLASRFGVLALATTRRSVVSFPTAVAPTARFFASEAGTGTVSNADLEKEASIFYMKSRIAQKYGPKLTFPGVSGSYAKDLFTKANANGSLAAVWNDFSQVLEKVVASKTFQHVVLFTPTEELEPKFKKVVKYEKLNPTTQQFIDSLFKNKQVKFLVSIVPKFRAMYEQESGVTNLNLTLAEVPSKGELVETLKRLESFDLFNESQPLKLSITIDPEIIGGLMASTDTRRVDWSDKTRYESFKKKLEQAGKESLAAYRGRVMNDFPKSWEELPFKN